MENLLLLVHRIPYPPNKGDKVRSFHLLRFLHRHFKVHLGCFIDDDKDWEYEHNLDSYCASRLVRPLNKTTRKFASMRGLLTGSALSVPYYSDGRMQRWVDKTIARHNIKKVVVFSSAMAQFVMPRYDSLLSIMDFVDVDSDKWRQYANSKSGLAKWVYTREAGKLEAYEKRACEFFDKSFFVSKDEAKLFSGLCAECGEKIDYYNNGVDYQFFNPELNLDNPYAGTTKEGNADADGGGGEKQVIVFSGAMDYWANIDAITWFATEIFTQIRDQLPAVELYIVGSNPSSQVLKLEELENVHVTGRVDDVRPYINHASLVVAPMRIARGVQNKVLEAMSFNKPIVATTYALEGIEACADFDISPSDTTEEFALTCVDRLRQPSQAINYRQCVIQHYDWNRNLNCLMQSLGVND